MISIKSLSVYLIITIPIYIYGLISQIMINNYNNYITFYGYNLLQNFTIIYIMKHKVNKPIIKENHRNEEKYLGEFFLNTLYLLAIKAQTHMWIYNNLLSFNNFDLSNNIDLYFFDFVITFIFKGFIYELIFDFQHYWIHRIIHGNKFLYQVIHKKHHKFNHPSTDTTYYMSGLDVIVTHCLPLIITSYIVNLTQYEFLLMNIYLSYQEIGGHIGKKMSPTSSFAQAVWIPKWLQIELYTEDHDLHHSKINCNYAKRFSLWDKLFNTYIKG